MHYLSYLAEKLVAEAGAEELRAHQASNSQEDLVAAVRSVLEQEVEGGRLRYNVLHAPLREADAFVALK